MKLRRILALGALLGTLTACGGRELAGVELVEVLGVDGGGPVTLTALAGEGHFSAQGTDVADAQRNLQKMGEKRMEVTHVGQVVLGEDAPAEEILTQLVLHRKSGYGARVWLAQGTAGELLKGQKTAAQRLRSLTENANAAPPGVMEALSAILRGDGARVPVLGAEGEMLVVLGYREVRSGN